MIILKYTQFIIMMYVPGVPGSPKGPGSPFIPGSPFSPWLR